jgi:hypothetical protein
MTNLSGITRKECPAGCKADRCVISARPICSHPCLGGVQESLKSDPGVMMRHAEACKALGIQNKHEVV